MLAASSCATLPYAPCSAGFDVLTLMEKVPTDDDDRPLQVGPSPSRCLLRMPIGQLQRGMARRPLSTLSARAAPR